MRRDWIRAETNEVLPLLCVLAFSASVAVSWMGRCIYGADVWTWQVFACVTGAFVTVTFLLPAAGQLLFDVVTALAREKD